MRNKITLNDYTEHPSKQAITDAGIRQYDLAYSLGIGQSRLSQMLRGIRPMPVNIENKIQTILESLKPKPEPKPEPKKRKKPAKKPKPKPEKKKRIIKPKKA